MKVKCLFGHKFGEWQKVDEYLERKCLRCGKQEVVFPSWQSILVKSLASLVTEFCIEKFKGKKNG